MEYNSILHEFLLIHFLTITPNGRVEKSYKIVYTDNGVSSVGSAFWVNT